MHYSDTFFFAFIGLLGMYSPLTFLDVFGVEFAHQSPEFSFYTVSFANAASFFGRLSAGFMADAFGCLNVLLGFNIAAAIATFAWPRCTEKASLVAVSLIYGWACSTSRAG